MDAIMSQDSPEHIHTIQFKICQRVDFEWNSAQGCSYKWNRNAQTFRDVLIVDFETDAEDNQKVETC